MNDMQSIANQFYNETARIEEMILLAGVMDSQSIPECLESFLEEDNEILERCFGPIPDYIKKDFEEEEYEEFMSWLYTNKKLGFLIQIATPVMKWHSDSGASYSWGHYGTRWVYGDTLDDALQSGFAWVAERRAKEKTGVQP